jgi:HEAT repeat protein
MSGLAYNISKMGEPAIAPMVKFSEDSRWQIKLIAGQALANLNYPEARKALDEAYKREDLAVIAGASEYFARMGIPGSEAVIIRAMDEYSSYNLSEAFVKCGNKYLEKAVKLDCVNKNYCYHCLSCAAGNTKWGSGVK